VTDMNFYLIIEWRFSHQVSYTASF